MNWLRLDYRKIAALIFIISLPILSLNLHKPGENPWVLRPFSFVAGSIQEIYVGFTTSVQSTAADYVHLVGINSDIRKLTEINSALQSKLLSYDELALENLRLRELLKLPSKIPAKTRVAQVVGLDLFAERSTLRISIGAKDGVKKGMAVVHPQGVVGYVLAANLSSSIVLLLTDRYAVIDARVQRSRARGVVKGLNPNEAEIVYLQRTDDVEIGDKIVTSGLDNIFPSGYPIASVETVTKESSGITQEVILRPMIDTSQLEEVFVVFDVLNPEVEILEEAATVSQSNKTTLESN
ncbi:MAG: rod shape-determining protein MreC [Bdellovibrionales bacterium]